MPGLLSKKWKCKQDYELQERQELSMIKLSLLLTYSTFNNPGEKRKKGTKKKYCVSTTQHSLLMLNYRLYIVKHAEWRRKKT